MSSADSSNPSVINGPVDGTGSETGVDTTLPAELQRILFQVAEESISRKLKNGELLEVDPECYPAPLRERRATFVTLRVQNKLRGCMGSLTAHEPLVVDVAMNAVAAATRDRRFPHVELDEVPRLDIHISILSPPEPIVIASEAELLQVMRPGIDGLILHEGDRRGTLLPAVWENVTTPEEFLMHLKQKAGLPTSYWSETIRIERYTAQSLHMPVD